MSPSMYWYGPGYEEGVPLTDADVEWEWEQRKRIQDEKRRDTRPTLNPRPLMPGPKRARHFPSLPL